MSRSLKFIFTVMLLAHGAFGEDIISENQQIMIDSKEIGQIYKGAEVINEGSGYKIKGYVMSGNEYMLFYSNENRIRLARIKDEFTGFYKVISQSQDVYGVKWKEVELTFNLKDGGKIAPKNTNIWAKEEELYQRCGSCHASFHAEEYTVNQWPNVIKTMSERSGLTKDETRSVGAYMQYLALKHHK
ncbi:hypothetical protein ACHJH3_02510 [Campylobacter sp. MOP7]|uniref:hypothetical protein n=1 Tax=Campylobacter canis TaxID=3378588 RepID=UPI00387ED526